MTVKLTFQKLLFSIALLTSISARAQLMYVTNADDLNVTITGYTNSVPSTLVIPTNINGLVVTAIGYSAFFDFNTLVNVAIPSTVTDIGVSAFSNTGLTNVSIPYGVTNIDEAAFAGSGYLTNATIPESVTYIGPGAFSDTGLLNVTIPGSVTNIGQEGFADNETLTNVILEPGITSLSNDVFGGNPNLPSVTIPASVTNIQNDAFRACESLTSAFFMGNAPAVDNTSFVCEYQEGPPTFQDVLFYVTTAYYLPGTAGWEEFSSNTVYQGTSLVVPAVEWNPTIQATGTNFGVQNGQYGFDITATTNLPIAIEACDDLSQSNWVVLQRLSLTNGLFHFSEPFQSNSPARFYRIGFP